MERQNKLQIHHVAKRLPYGLKVINGWGDVKTLNYAHLDDENRGYISQCTPILFPLSSLTETITIKGESFVPIEVFKDFTDHKVKFEKPDYIILKDSYSIEQNVLGAPLAIIEKLHEWHIDYENLIEKGLAISVFDLTESPRSLYM